MTRPSPERIEEAMALLYRLTLKRELGVDAEVEVKQWNGSAC